jgi:hypothetical protein
MSLIILFFILIRFNIYGQIIEHPDNSANANASVFLCIKMGTHDSLIYTQEFTFNIGSNTTVTVSFKMSI